MQTQVNKFTTTIKRTSLEEVAVMKDQIVGLENRIKVLEEKLESIGAKKDQSRKEEPVSKPKKVKPVVARTSKKKSTPKAVENTISKPLVSLDEGKEDTGSLLGDSLSTGGLLD